MGKGEQDRCRTVAPVQAANEIWNVAVKRLPGESGGSLDFPGFNGHL